MSKHTFILSCKNGLLITKDTIILYYYSMIGVCLHFEADHLFSESTYLFHPCILSKILIFEVFLFGNRFGRPLIFLAFYHFHISQIIKLPLKIPKSPEKSTLSRTHRKISFIIRKRLTKFYQKSHHKILKYPVKSILFTA